MKTTLTTIDEKSLKIAKINRDNIIFGTIPANSVFISGRKYSDDGSIKEISSLQVIRSYKNGKLCYGQERIAIINNNNEIIDSVDILSLIELIRGNIQHLL